LIPSSLGNRPCDICPVRRFFVNAILAKTLKTQGFAGQHCIFCGAEDWISSLNPRRSRHGSSHGFAPTIPQLRQAEVMAEGPYVAKPE
jgi:hypothetical protein